MAELKRYWIVMVAGLLAASVIAFVFAERSWIRSDAGWRYASEVITGNWSPDQPDQAISGTGPISDGWYIVGLLGAMLINYGPFVILFGAFRALVEGKRVMNLMMAISVRDELAKNSLTKLLSQSMSPEQAAELIDSAYRTAEATWQERLGSMIGKKGVSQVLEEMRKNKFPEAHL